MDKKKLYMIGNSHIDPVWFWNWDEGMQEVKATFASALDRMKEYEEFKFTSTSTAFFEWIEKTVPTMFEEIKKRVAEGRWELTGGWFIEPDCNLPGGEAFVRQGLYSQRYLKEKFGKISKIGSNVDSFGHGPNLPQFLKRSGMDHYVMMRPRRENPVFLWESEDGSQVNAISLPGEYTTWFYEPTKQNIELTLAAMKEYDQLPCCYGVGNHGGGPTIENIKSIYELRGEFPDLELAFGTFTEFFDHLEKNSLEVVKKPFEKVNTGCYAMDSELKRMNRFSENRLKDADMLLSMAYGCTGSWLMEASKMKELWKLLLFNQFHDTLGGTAIKEARDEALMQFSTVSASSGEIKALAIQAMINTLDTTGDGFPLFLFHTGGQEYHGYVTVELNWFCQHPLKLLSPSGDEIPYQRVHTKAKVRNYVLGGRRNIVFYADIPACGYAMYRVLIEESNYCYNNEFELDREDPYTLENEYIKVSFDQESGLLHSLIDKQTGYESLKAPVSYQIWIDERDTWGGKQGRPYEYTGEDMKLRSIEKVESGKIRECVRAIYEHGGSYLEQLYYLYAGEQELVVENRLFWDKNWHEFKIGLPLGFEIPDTKAEGSYGTISRTIIDEDEYYMHRFLDAANEQGKGLAIANDSKYSFSMSHGMLLLTVARSAVYAQGNGRNWYCPLESYEYTDIGKNQFTYVIRPHGEELPVPELYRMANRVNGAYDYLFDSCHGGLKKASIFSLASTDQTGVEIMSIKKAEDDGDLIVRILETEGKDREYTLNVLGSGFDLNIGHHEIQTLKIKIKDPLIRKVNFLEYEDD
ncbi:MAG: alpha-mannosidase [Herbinix sp.]|nr:alpha-mannosidase [Herbinix sp.]